MIFSVNELYKIDFSTVLETSIDTIRKSTDNKTFVKWDGEMPQCVLELTTKEGPFSYQEMIIILNDVVWSNNNQGYIYSI